MSGAPFLWSAFSDNRREQSVGFQRDNAGTGEFGYIRDYPLGRIANQSDSSSAVEVLAAGQAYEIP
jgi:hypothetical protein